MTDAGAAVAVSAHIAVLSRMLTAGVDDRVDEFMQVAAERSVAVVSGLCAAVVLSTENEPSRERALSTDVDVVMVGPYGGGSPAADALLALGSESIRYDAVVVVDDTSHPSPRWATLASQASGAVGGMRAFPIRAGAEAIGALVVGTAGPWLAAQDRDPAVPTRDSMGVQVLADLLGAAIMLFRDPGVSVRMSRLLPQAVAERAEFEQAAGIVAERHSLDRQSAADVMTGILARSGKSASAVARSIIDGGSVEDIELEGIDREDIDIAEADRVRRKTAGS